MLVRSVHDRDELAGLLGRDPGLHAYELGDLDDYFWPYTTWYRHRESVALVYHGTRVPTLLALGRPERMGDLIDLVAGISPLLPRRFWAHLSPGVESVLTGQFRAGPAVRHLKMDLTDPTRLAAARLPDDGSAAAELVPLGDSDLPELTAFYQVAYPGNWFAPRMLGTGQYLGVRRDGELLAVAGVHVWSPTYRVAALGNIATHPAARGLGLGTAVVAGLCRRMLPNVDHIALNVKADNAAAVALYRRLGFTPEAEYTEAEFGEPAGPAARPTDAPARPAAEPTGGLAGPAAEPAGGPVRPSAGAQAR